MLGFNGGLMGVRRVPTGSAATGLWFQNEQSVARRAAIWPSAGDPTPGLSPVLWYDFADQTTVTTSGTEITAVTSKGSRAWTLSKSATGPQYVTGINGKKCVDWGSSNHGNYLRNATTTTTAISEIYVVMDGAFGGTYTAFGGLITACDDPGWRISGINTSYNQESTGFDSAYINGGATNRFGTSHFTSPSVDNPSVVRILNSGSASFNTNQGVQLGNDRSNFSLGSRGWLGLMGEVICFSSVLNSTDRDSLQSWLASKWGITLV
jgi:hypothetical protein